MSGNPEGFNIKPRKPVPGEIVTASEREHMAARKKAKPTLLALEAGLARIDAALEALKNISGMYPDTGPVDQLASGMTPEGRELTAAVNATRGAALGLTRVPGIGSQSNIEFLADMASYPSNGDYRNTNIESAKMLRLRAQAIREAYDAQSDADEERMNQSNAALHPAPRGMQNRNAEPDSSITNSEAWMKEHGY